MNKHVNDFLDWWLEAPLYQSVWLVPFVAVLYAAAILINLVSGDKKNEKNQ